MSAVSEQAKALAKALDPHRVWNIDQRLAQRAVKAGWVQRDTLIAELEAQGWTPPPDPAAKVRIEGES